MESICIWAMITSQKEVILNLKLEDKSHIKPARVTIM